MFGQPVTGVKAAQLSAVRRRMGMVFQSFNLFAHLTVIENIMLGPVQLLGCTRQQAYERGMRLLASVGLAEKALNYPMNSPAGKSSVSPLPEPWGCSRKSYSLTSRPARWIPPWWGKCCRLSAAWAGQG